MPYTLPEDETPNLQNKFNRKLRIACKGLQHHLLQATHSRKKPKKPYEDASPSQPEVFNKFPKPRNPKALKP